METKPDFRLVTNRYLPLCLSEKLVVGDGVNGSSGATTAKMETTGFHILLLAFLGDLSTALKQCDNCVHINDCRQWCSKLKKGLSHLKLDERAEFNDNICEYAFDKVPPVKMCCDSPAEEEVCERIGPQIELKQGPKDASKDAKCGQIKVEGEGQCGGCEDAFPGAWPWMTRLLYQANNNDKEKDTTFCGGALVSAKHVVTAAHCVNNEKFGKPTAVTLGELDVTTEYDCFDPLDECGGDGKEGKACFEEGRCAAKRKKYSVSETFVHPDYVAKTSVKKSTHRFDAAVLVLDRPVQFTTTIQPICVPSKDFQNEAARRTFALKGWGNEVKGFATQKSATVLQQLMGLQETPLDECKRLVGRVASLEDQHMCVWKPRSGANACQGDSGGPVSEVIRKDAYDKGFWQLAGIVSFGVISSCASNTPLVVTRVEEPSILNWIIDKIGKDMPVRPK